MHKSAIAFLLLALCPLVVAQQAMNNDAVIKMVKAGLSDEVVVATVNSAPGAYGTSADDLIALKQAGVSDRVIAAIIAKSAGPVAPPASAAPAAAAMLPPGSTDVGVYYKDKNGAWISLMPEIVNFKTGGVMKSIATGGVVKGDLNGHIAGKQAKIALTFPVALAVFLPEGTDITEYQLLHLRENGNAREFRSVTGGVFHVSGGATRDSRDYQPKKLASRVYQITLEAGMGKGEYGLLPPGAYGSSNLGSSGKIYAVSVPE
jgi:hypothetical protein